MLCDITQEYPIAPHKTWQWLDSSKIKEYQTCPRSFLYKYVCGFQEDTSHHLVIGNAWHAMMEVIGLPYQDLFPQEASNRFYTLVDNGINVDIAGQIICMEHPILSRAITAANDQIYEGLAEEIWEQYDKQWFPKIPRMLPLALLSYINGHIIDSLQYDIVLMNDKPLQEVGGAFLFSVNDVQIPIKFRWDKVVKDRATQQIIIREHKTAGSLYNVAAQWDLAVQPNTYAAALAMFSGKKWDAEIVVEMDILAFNRLKPDETKNRTKDKKDPFRYFSLGRENIRKSTNGFRIWYGYMMSTIRDIMDDFRELRDTNETDPILFAFSPRPLNCGFMYGRKCPFFDLCATYPNPISFINSGSILPGMERRYWDPDEHRPPKIRADISMD